ncbi:hypothetical protein [Candidatus Hodgkinia cicadicola]
MIKASAKSKRLIESMKSCYHELDLVSNQVSKLQNVLTTHTMDSH